ncbi:hypothetical protein FI667_g13705, partial [Globisporangium splendens]
MPFKCARPEERASASASASSSAASTFYNDGQSASYTTQANAAIQRDLTHHALELLRFGTVSLTSSSSEHPGGEHDDMWLLLDLGAGSGLSTLAANEWLLEQNLLGFTMAFDISSSMLSLTASNDKDKNDVNKDNTDALCLQHAGFYRGNAAQRFPLRSGVFHAAIGISMLQWLTKEGLETCFASLREQLVGNSPGHGRAVFQVYPSSIEYVDLMEQTAKKMGFQYAEVFVAFPHSTTAKKWYFCVDKHGDDGSSASEANKAAGTAHTLCLFGRRFHRRCAWHLLQSKKSKEVDALRDRLGREHVKTAWHIWRKFRRSIAGNVQGAVHAKAKRSLELWKSDEVIGNALQTRFVPPGSENEEGVNAVTYELLLSQMDDVVDILHTLLEDSYAPLLPYESFFELRMLEDSDASPDGVELVRGIVDTLVPERRGLLESLLLLLYRLALKRSPQSNSQVLGEVVGSILARPSEVELTETTSLRRRIGIFLISNAPIFLRKEDEDDNKGREHDESEDHAWVESGAKKRSSLSETKVTTSDKSDPLNLATNSLEHSTQSTDPISLRSPKDKMSRAGSAMLTSTKETLQRISPKRFSSRPPTFVTSETAPSRPHLSNREVLTEADMLMLTRLLTAIIESPQDKRGLFVEHPSHDDELRALGQIVSSNIGKELKYLPIESFSVLAIAMSVKQHLRTRAGSLIGVDSLELMIEKLSSESDEDDVKLVAMTRNIVEGLDDPTKALLYLVVACARLSLDAGTDQEAVEGSVVDCIIGRNGSQESAAVEASAKKLKQIKHVIFVELHHLLQPAGTDQQDERSNLAKSAIHSSEKHHNQVIGAIYAALWVYSCATTSGAFEQPHISHLQKLEETTAAGLCSLMDFLLDKANEELRHPLPDLYVCFVDELEEKIICEKLCQNDTVSFGLYSPHSLANAVKEVLSNVFQPLVLFKLLCHAEMFENVDVESELNIWRFEALVMKELSPMKKRLVESIFTHLSLISDLCDSPESIKELLQVVGDFLFHPPADARVLVGDFCSRVLQAGLFTGKWTRSRGASRVRPSHRTPLMHAASSDPQDAPTSESKSSSQQAPAMKQLLLSSVASRTQDRTAAPTDEWAITLDLTVPPATLAEFLASASALFDIYNPP